MALRLTNLGQLTADEEEARKRYIQESALLNAVLQGWSDQLKGDYDAVIADLRHLKLAVQKAELLEPATLFSGHGNAFGLIGSLGGDLTKLAGFTYQYSGFVSTSEVEQKARTFVENGKNMGGPRILLELHLPSGFRLLNMTTTSSGGEFEYLVGPGVAFEIFESVHEIWHGVGNPVYRLKLRPLPEAGVANDSQPEE